MRGACQPVGDVGRPMGPQNLIRIDDRFRQMVERYTQQSARAERGELDLHGGPRPVKARQHGTRLQACNHRWPMSRQVSGVSTAVNGQGMAPRQKQSHGRARQGDSRGPRARHLVTAVADDAAAQVCCRAAEIPAMISRIGHCRPPVGIAPSYKTPTQPRLKTRRTIMKRARSATVVCERWWAHQARSHRTEHASSPHRTSDPRGRRDQMAPPKLPW